MNKEQTNYITIQLLIAECTKLLRNIFCECWKKIFNSEWDDKVETKKYFSKGKGKFIRDKLKKRQQINLDNGNSVEWDITLFCTILLSEPFNKTLNEKFQKSSIQTLNEIRYKLCNISSMILSDNEFEELSEKLKKIMVNLGLPIELVIEIIENKGYKFIDENILTKYKEFKESAKKEFENKNYSKAIEIYTSALILPNLKNQEVGILYCNRSLAYLKLYKESKDERDIYRSLNDANQTCNYYPDWYKGYARLGEIYYELNELNYSKQNYEKALVFNPNDDEIRNLLANTNFKIGKQLRQDYLNKQLLPVTTEEAEEKFINNLINQRGYNNTDTKTLKKFSDETKKIIEETDASLKDVWLGHEFRDGSNNIKQDYEMAARYYSKAAQKNNAEAMYNLALLTMNGQGVKKDFPTAIALLKQAASQKPTRELFGREIPNVGVAEAEHSLGLAYQNGIYVEKNFSIASKWYSLSVEHGNGSAANNLGVMYNNGYGVVKNNREAERLLILAFERGDPNSSSNLVDLYIQENDPERALMWHERSLKNNCLFSLSRDEVVREMIESMKKSKFFYNKKNNIKSRNFESIEEFINIINNFENIVSPIRMTYLKFDRNELFKYSLKGSKTAGKMVDALDHFYEALYLLENETNYNINEFMKNLSYAYQTESIVCQVPISLLEKIEDLVNSSLKENKNNKIIDEFDLNCRICYANMNFEDPSFIINFLNASLILYPKNLKLLELRGCAYGFLEKFEKALEDFSTIVDIQPDNYENLYNKACALMYLTDKASINKSITCFQKFIFEAPIDHRMIPDAYYSLALIYFKSGDCKNFKNVNEETIKYYNKGLETEKNQLPCFLPYVSDKKKLLEPFILAFEDKKCANLKKTINKIEDEKKIMDHKSKILIKTFRKTLNDSKNMKTKNYCKVLSTYKPNKEQKMPLSLIGLKEIFIKDIDFTKDHILNGYILTLTIFDVPIIGVFESVQLLVEDQYQYLKLLSIYNLGKNFKEIREKFSIGTIFSIINPYIRLSVSGEPMLRVDDPKTIIFTGKIKENMCRYCGKEESKFTCGSCNIAKYCSKDCQTNDWKLLDHKLICS